MKKIGLLGGMTWQSTASYYALMQQLTSRERGGLHSAAIVMESLDFDEVFKYQSEPSDWDGLGCLLADSVERLVTCGALVIGVCSNTPHHPSCLRHVTARIKKAHLGDSVQFVHIAECCAKHVRASGITSVGLLATSFTVEGGFFQQALQQCGVSCVVPTSSTQDLIQSIIYTELAVGKVTDSARRVLQECVSTMVDQSHVQGIVLGCTELQMLLSDSHMATRLLPKTPSLSLNQPRVQHHAADARSASSAHHAQGQGSTQVTDDVRRSGCQSIETVPLFDTLCIHAAALVAQALAPPS